MLDIFEGCPAAGSRSRVLIAWIASHQSQQEATQGSDDDVIETHYRPDYFPVEFGDGDNQLFGGHRSKSNNSVANRRRM